MFQRKYRMPQNLIFAVTKTTSFERKRRVVISISLETINQTNIYGADHYLDFRILRSGTASRYTEIHFLHNKCLSKKRNRPKKRPPNAKSSNANEVPPHSLRIESWWKCCNLKSRKTSTKMTNDWRYWTCIQWLEVNVWHTIKSFCANVDDRIFTVANVWQQHADW